MGRALKIFHVNMHHHWGGQPNRILTESLGLRELGHEPWVAGPRGCLLVERARAAGLKTFDDLELRRGFRPASALRDLRALTALFRRERFDIIHPHGSQDAWLSLLAARRLSPRPPLVRTRHNTFPIAGHALNRWHYRQFDWVITISPQVNPLVEAVGFPAEKITAVYSAPDPTRFYPREGDPRLRAELGIPAGAPVVGMVGRLAPEKGHGLILRAFARVRGRFPEARLVLVGKGRSQPEIEALAEELGIKEQVILTGFRTDVPDLVALFDIFALTPISGESLGTSILEAFCMEKPAVATEVGGTGESVRNGETGFLIPEGPEEEKIAGIADALTRLLGDAELRRRMGVAGRQLVERQFTPRRLAEQCAQIYARLTQTAPENPPVGL
ncbi:MAG TPA: glycosyltransferase family 4 protein [Candidatus Sumerlaeota bacterium]|nr:glycosyltransferase family 4 protein [Candidatus Sumerlaeota bacterium]HOR27841.1 glycosyltransferase family 4 protein [Candidatus Sumerlaeota bacterium]